MKNKNIIKIMIGVMIVGMLMIGIMIPVSASEIGQEPSNATTASTSIISLNTTNLSIVEGDTFSLTATTQPSGLSVTWRSTNTTVATVSSSGIVTANKAGETLISASVVSNGSTYTSYCTVYVYIPTGIYYVKNYQSNYYLNVFQGRASNNTNVEQYGKYADSVSGATRTRQMWRINYLGNGVYSIRPLNKLDMGLYTNVNNVVIYNIGTTDTFSGVPYSMQWTIEWYSTGYIFRNDGHESLTMQVANSSTTSGANVIVGNYSDSLTCARWTLETVSSPPTGTFLYNTATGTAVSSSQEYVAPNETRTLSMFQLAPTFYSGETIDQQFYWYGNNSSVATVDESTGAITGVSPGTALITGLMDLDGYFYYVNYTVIVTEVANGTYYLKNKQTGYYADIYGPTMASGTTIQQWEFHGGDWQKWTFTHVGDGYYSIRSNNSTTPYYLGVKNDSSVVDSDIVLRSGSLTNGMKWTIEATTISSYKIIPKTGEDYDYVLATSTSSAANGYKLIQGDYIDNTSYRDEWLLEPYSVVFYGVTNSNHNHISCLNTIADTMSNNNWNDIIVRSGAISAIVCRYDLLSTNVFTSRSHGLNVMYSGTENVASTGILLNDATETSDYVAFYSHLWSSMPSASTYILSNDDYKNIDVALFIGCNTAKGGEGARNLPTTIVEYGAWAAIGFSDTIGCSSANTWTNNFYEKMLNGATLQEAVDYACSLASTSSGLIRDNVVICGDSTFRFPIN